MANLTFAGLCLGGFALLLSTLWERDGFRAPQSYHAAAYQNDAFQKPVQAVNAAFAAEWEKAGLTPAPQADSLAVARRLSLGLTGTIPSFEEVRALERQPEEERVQWWLSYLFEDQRYSDFVAERLARVFVSTDFGPFLIYRRDIFVAWLSDQVRANRPYDELARTLISGQGLATSQPESNFITFTMMPGEKGRQEADPVKLAARTNRAFLGVRMDCMQCHDDKFGDHWKQEHFHEVAAFFATPENVLTGVRDNAKRAYDFRFLGEATPRMVPAAVPFHPELLPAEGNLRERLGRWVTHPENRAFARTAVNRSWALITGKPLVEPIDDIPLEGPWPAAMELLADDFTAHGYDLQRLMRIIAASRAFQLDSRSDDPAHPVTEKHEKHWAAFPVSRLRPEQVAQSVIQASSLKTIDADAHVVRKLQRWGQTNDFVKRYGDLGENEFNDEGGTIPQRLLLMNGKLVSDQTQANFFMNAAPRLTSLTRNPDQAVETAYLSIFTRRPTPEEATVFGDQLRGLKGNQRSLAFQDLYWTLLNSTEFSWNH